MNKLEFWALARGKVTRAHKLLERHYVNKESISEIQKDVGITNDELYRINTRFKVHVKRWQTVISGKSQTKTV